MTFVFDLHSDILIDVAKSYQKGIKNNKEKRDLGKWQEIMSEGKIKGRILSVWIEDVYKPGNTLKRAIDLVEIAKKEITSLKNAVLIQTRRDLDNFSKDKNYYYLISLEGADPIYDDIFLLDAFYDLGVRLITLTWSTRNFVADGVFESRTKGGLTRFGLELLDRMKELGIIVDLSHISETGFWDVIENYDGLVVASHSDSRSVNDHPRNLTDEQAKAIAERGGIVGLNVIPSFVGLNKDLESFIKHLEHFIDLIGIDYVGFGFDFVYYLYDSYEGISGLETEKDVPSLINRLLENYSKDEVEKICWKNAVRVLRKALI